MGTQKYLKSVEELFKKSPVVSFRSIEMIARNKKSTQYAKQLIRNLIKQGKLKKLTKGFYTSHEDVSLLVFCFKPAYLGLQNALSFHNLWEQETIPVVITAKKIRQGVRKVLGINVLIRRINKKYLFGFDYYKEGNFYFPYSDLEKTFIDMIYFKQPISQEVINNFKEKIDRKKLNSYLNKYPKRFKGKVLTKLSLLLPTPQSF